MSRTEEALDIVKVFEETAKKPEYAFCQDNIRDAMKLSVMMDIMLSLAVIADRMVET